jgi:hypothetical protein
VPSSNADALAAYVNGERYRKERKWYSRPLESFLSPELLALASEALVPHHASNKRLFCRVTRREVNRIPREIIKHLLSARFERARDRQASRRGRGEPEDADEAFADEDEDAEAEEDEADANLGADVDEVADADAGTGGAVEFIEELQPKRRARQRDKIVGGVADAGAGTGEGVGLSACAGAGAGAARRGTHRVAFQDDVKVAGVKRTREKNPQTKAEKRRARIVEST